MKFVYFGNFGPSFSTENHFVKSLESLGHKVIKLQENTTETDIVLKESIKTDALIWSHTHSFYPQGKIDMSAVLAELKSKQIPSIAYHLDLFMGIPERWRFYQNHDYFNVEYFFTPDKKLAEWITTHKNKGYYMPAGVFDKECVEAEKTDIEPIIFVGSKSYHRQWQYRPNLINWLKNTYGERFGHYGHDGIRVLREMDLNSAYQSAKIIVGDSYSPNYNYPDFWSDRVYETTGRGGFIIHPYIKGIETQFNITPKDPEIITYPFGDSNALKYLIDYYLEHEDEREKIRLAGTKRTKKDHTYKKRWEKILEIIK